MARNDNVFALMPIEVEFQKEKAAGLRRTGEKLDQALAALAGAERELLSARGPERTARLGRYRELRKEAERVRWGLMVQREACGLRGGDLELERAYPLPPLIRE
ncbi:hypothetical protein NVS55_14035 [Myxococcus stipitatus]|uniref:hypothetical protein n=1 Tax=Myxococcus stipitatus TaxID=83455 RepID=UPI0031456355